MEYVIEDSGLDNGVIQISGSCKSDLFGELSFQSIDEQIHSLTCIHFWNDTKQIIECGNVIKDWSRTLPEGMKASTGGVD
jgi:hypothetical protein